jgi:hypothetical protein
MCLSCGCGEPNEQHGDERHIIQADIEAAAKASDISTAEVITNIQKGMPGVVSGE